MQNIFHLWWSFDDISVLLKIVFHSTSYQNAPGQHQWQGYFLLVWARFQIPESNLCTFFLWKHQIMNEDKTKKFKYQIIQHEHTAKFISKVFTFVCFNKKKETEKEGNRPVFWWCVYLRLLKIVCRTTLFLWVGFFSSSGYRLLYSTLSVGPFVGQQKIYETLMLITSLKIHEIAQEVKNNSKSLKEPN